MTLSKEALIALIALLVALGQLLYSFWNPLRRRQLSTDQSELCFVKHREAYH
jgi:hypothetical protein